MVFLMDQIFDGHNGSAAAIYSKENLLNDILSAIPPHLKRDEWLAALPRAMVAGFMKTDKEFQARGKFGALYSLSLSLSLSRGCTSCICTLPEDLQIFLPKSQ